MSRISKNGITLEVNKIGNVLAYQVVDQKKSVAETLRLLVEVVDPETGYSLRSSRRPFFHKGHKRFYVRGTETQHNDLRVEAEFKSEAEANRALGALERLIDMVKLPECTVKDDQIVIGNGLMAKGGSSHIRMAFLTRPMAEKLQLTCCNFYQDKVIDWEPCKPAYVKNPHACEHLAQIVGVLNKAIDPNTKHQGYITNNHKITQEGSRKAVEFFREGFRRAEKEGWLTELWRVSTGLRAPDVE